jgi:hypothetical protein
MLDKVAVGLDTRWVNQGVTRMGNSTDCALSTLSSSRCLAMLIRENTLLWLNDLDNYIISWIEFQ